MSHEEIIALLGALPFKVEHRIKDDKVQVRCFETFGSFLKANDWYNIVKVAPLNVVVEIVATDGNNYGLGFGERQFKVRDESAIIVDTKKPRKKKVIETSIEVEAAVVIEETTTFKTMELADSNDIQDDFVGDNLFDIYDAEDKIEESVETFDSKEEVSEEEPISFPKVTNVVPELVDAEKIPIGKVFSKEEIIASVDDFNKSVAVGTDRFYEEDKAKILTPAGLKLAVLQDEKFLKQIDALGNPKVFSFRRKLKALVQNPELYRMFLWYTLVSEGIKSFAELIESEDSSFSKQVGILVGSKGKVTGEYLEVILKYPLIANIKMLELADYLDLTNCPVIDFEVIKEFHSQYKILEAYVK